MARLLGFPLALPVLFSHGNAPLPHRQPSSPNRKPSTGPFSRTKRGILAVLVTAVIALGMSPMQSFAHGGEDHGEKAVPAVAPAAARLAGFGAEGSVFQAVITPGKDGTSLLYLAEIDSNVPVAQASIEVEAGAWKGAAQAASSPGIYKLAWAPVPGAGASDATLVVEAGDQSDLILISGINQPQQMAPTRPGSAIWQPWMIGAGGAGGALLLAALLYRRSSRRTGTGLAIIAVMLLPLPTSRPVFAHGGEDHGGGGEAAHAAAVTPGAAVTLPKASQFILGIRTMRIEPRQAAETVRLVGKVVPDPSGYARLQPSQAARVVADANFPLPVPGQKVAKGQVVAVLEPNLSSIERSDKRASLYKVESEMELLERQLARWQQAPGLVAAKEVETARIQLEQLRKEKAQLSGTALGRQLLTAPIDGLVTDLHVVPGQMVTTDSVLVEIVDPAKLRIEAVLYDLTLAERIVGGTASTKLLPDDQFRLSLIGVSPRLDAGDQGLHLQFSVAETKGRLRLGMPLDVYAETGATRLQTAVPRDAVTEMGGRPVVFVRTAPESFEARPVKVERMVGQWAEIGEGLRTGDKVVLQGVAQLKAVR